MTSRTELTPLLFLERTAEIFGEKIGAVYRNRRISYAELAERSQDLAKALRVSGIREGDRVAYLMPNLPEHLIGHFGVPLARGILVSINTRLSPTEITHILNHSGAKALVADTALLGGIDPERCESLETIVTVDDTGTSADGVAYEEFVGSGSSEPDLAWRVDDEERTISINYTSGTTGQPKGVMYTHRGAYLNSLSEIIHSHHHHDSVYLWTLPMFHCNGWCTPWAVTAIAGRHICLRAVDPGVVWHLIEAEGVTHLNAAPTVLISMVNHPSATHTKGLVITTAGAPPSPTIIRQVSDLGAEIVHVYGLTETYGPHTVCEPQADWETLGDEERAIRLARQGVSYIGVEPIRVVDEQMRDVPRDGETLGEVVMRGNNVMKGYFDDPAATEEAFRGGWFHSGDLAVWHPDGYIELRDRAKDIIISGGENISTIEVERAVVSHPAILEAAVVAMPDPKWGERPVAFVIVRDGSNVDQEEIIQHVRGQIAHYKAPDRVIVVEELPKTSTGKIQKFTLREQLAQ